MQEGIQKVKESRPKVIGLNQLLNKKYDHLKELPAEFVRCFGKIVSNFIMCVYAPSSSGKSNFIYWFLTELMKHGNVLYISLEEGTEATAQVLADRHMNVNDHGGKIMFADHEMNYEETIKYLKRKKSQRFVVIDSVQYWGITVPEYKALKAMFPKKTFIYLSHTKGKKPDGRTADKILYDARIKVRIEGCVAFIKSSYLAEGGEVIHIIHEPSALEYWGKKKLNQFKNKKRS